MSICVDYCVYNIYNYICKSIYIFGCSSNTFSFSKIITLNMVNYYVLITLNVVNYYVIITLNVVNYYVIITLNMCEILRYYYVKSGYIITLLLHIFTLNRGNCYVIVTLNV